MTLPVRRFIQSLSHKELNSMNTAHNAKEIFRCYSTITSLKTKRTPARLLTGIHRPHAILTTFKACFHPLGYLRSVEIE